ncbi:hypothetical protein [Beijerinckia sp. L45]|uniref:hypothetical protein n=1 Tax=Beijerinckia sp. L45 TaxID=1641855 RepID=UPI00131EC84E|nr:hypothetical protein [Beijerinckia sp. L45]
MQVVFRTTKLPKSLAKALTKASHELGTPMMLTFAHDIIAQGLGHRHWAELHVRCLNHDDTGERPEFAASFQSRLKESLERNGWGDIADGLVARTMLKVPGGSRDRAGPDRNVHDAEDRPTQD